MSCKYLLCKLNLIVGGIPLLSLLLCKAMTKVVKARAWLSERAKSIELLLKKICLQIKWTLYNIVFKLINIILFQCWGFKSIHTFIYLSLIYLYIYLFISLSFYLLFACLHTIYAFIGKRITYVKMYGL